MKVEELIEKLKALLNSEIDIPERKAVPLEWVSLESDAARRGLKPAALRDLCRRMGVTMLGTPRNRLVSTREIDEKFNEQRRAIAGNDADAREIELGAAKLRKLKR